MRGSCFLFDILRHDALEEEVEKDLLLRRLTRSGDALPELRRLATSQRGGDRAHYVWAAGMRGRRPATGVAAPPWGCASCRVDPDDNMHEDTGPRPRRVCACLPTASKINVRNRAAHVKSPCTHGRSISDSASAYSDAIQRRVCCRQQEDVDLLALRSSNPGAFCPREHVLRR